MPNSPCLEPRCPNYAAPKGRGRCKEHARKRDRSINRAGRKVYNTAKWRHTRDAKRRQDSICERCGQALATVVHHRVDLADDGDPFDMTNLESLCASCHSSETRRRQVAA